MADKEEKPTIAAQPLSIKQMMDAIEDWRKQAEVWQKAVEGITALDSIRAASEAIEGIRVRDDAIKAALGGLGLGKQLAEIAESSKNLQEVMRLAEEGKLGPYSDETPIPELMDRMRQFKAVQKTALETGQVDSAAANEWFKQRWTDRRCSVCGIVTWAMAPQFAHISFAPPGVVGTPPSFPCVVLTCRNCGHVLFFNGITMGLVPEGTR